MKSKPTNKFGSSRSRANISVLHIPHSSRLIPPDERVRLAVSDGDLNAELLRMTDAFTAELFSPTVHEAERIVFPISRLVCDVERFPDDADEPMAARGMGAVYTATSTGADLRVNLSLAERDRIMMRWYRPHHEMLTSAVDQVLTSHGHCLVVDCHSFSSHPLPHEPDQVPERPNICIGTDPFHTPNSLATMVANAAKDLGLTVDFDRPFVGTIVPVKHYRSDNRVSSIMIEVNRGLYMDEESGERLASFAQTKEAVAQMLSAAAAALVAD